MRVKRMTVEEYLDLDRADEGRWEYVNGEVIPVAGSPEHALVTRNVAFALGRALEGRPCIVFPDGLKVATTATGAYHYPDASVFCEPASRDSRDEHAFTNPTVLVEVLSPSTEDYDRGGKLEHYRSLHTLREYVLVAIEERSVERHRRLPSGDWLMSEVREGSVHLESLGVDLVLADLWADLDRLPPLP